MLRICLCAAMIAASVATASAQAPAPAKSKWSLTHIKEMRAKWKANKPKYKACRTEVKKKGLAGDDRWFFMEECMGKA